MVGEPDPDRTLTFVIDDTTTDTEQSSGTIARLRIFDDALSPGKIGNLGI